jgi:hypothetical protein
MNIIPLNLLRKLIALISVIVGAPLLHAAPITWGAATNVTAATNISTTGSLEFARAEGSASATTVNGVTFVAANTLGSAASGLLDGASTGDSDFDTLLDSISYGGGSGLVPYELGTLSLGQTYEIQVFFVDQRTSGNDRVMQSEPLP